MPGKKKGEMLALRQLYLSFFPLSLPLQHSLFKSTRCVCVCASFLLSLATVCALSPSSVLFELRFFFSSHAGEVILVNTGNKRHVSE